MSAKRRPKFRPGFDALDARILLSANPLAPAHVRHRHVHRGHELQKAQQPVSGISPTQIRQAYAETFNFKVNGLSYTANGAGQTIAIVIGGLDPYISNDLSTFDSKYGLAPPPNFQNVYFPGAQNGESADNIMETSLDVEWAHAVAPGANILLVQASSMNTPDLVTAVNWARQQPGVSVVSMSWGGAESPADHQYDSIFTTPAGHTGVTFVASAGDDGAWTNPQKTQAGVEWPAADPDVLSVGGTSLSINSSGTYLGESAWNDGGGGYSKVYAEPYYQYGAQNTGVRTVPDVSYDGDPNTGFSLYDSLAGGWTIVAGTSAGAPQWAGLIALANQGRALDGLLPLDGYSQTLPALYEFSSAFRDVTSGSNGFSATPGYDVATGLGTPIAIDLVGDLAFHVNTNYDPSSDDSVAIASSHAMPAASQSSFVTATPLVVVGTSVQARPGIDAMVDTGAADSSTQQPIAIGLAPTTPPGQLQSIGRRHDHLDRALESLMDDELAFSRS